ncbi:DJ-1/PfpI family protein [Fredinandcohnia humi]
MKKVGFIVYDHFAMWQVSLLQMFLKNAGYQIEPLSISGGGIATDGGISILTEPLSKANSKSYSLVLFPGGNVTEEIIEDPTLQHFLQTFDGLIAASCASAAIVAGAGILKGNYTCVPIAKERFSRYFTSSTYTDNDVCVNDRIITSKGHAHFEFMMAVLNGLRVMQEDPRLESMALKLGRNV